MAKKQTKPCSIGCYSECSYKCDYLINNECMYQNIVAHFRNRVVLGADNGF